MQHLCTPMNKNVGHSQIFTKSGNTKKKQQSDKRINTF